MKPKKKKFQFRREASNALFEAAMALEDEVIANQLRSIREETIARVARREGSASRCEVRGNAAYQDGELIHMVLA